MKHNCPCDLSVYLLLKDLMNRIEDLETGEIFVNCFQFCSLKKMSLNFIFARILPIPLQERQKIWTKLTKIGELKVTCDYLLQNREIFLTFFFL